MNNEEIWLLKEKYNGEKTDGFFVDVLKLKAGVPLAYLIGHVPFLSATIYLDSHPLIPRTETEFWVEKAIADIRKFPNPKVLDLCAGSGCIGIAVLKALAEASVDFAEIDVAHHETIRKNREQNSIDASRGHIYGGNLFELITDMYDVILSNPPYIDASAGTVDEQVFHNEPHGALFGGHLGLELIERIIAEAPTHLTPNGRLYIEHEPHQSARIQACGLRYGFSVQTMSDQYNIERYSVLARTSAPIVAE